ncbi:dynein light chain roadblock-type 2-like isoform X1 [Biomphalaria glabrata]|uniref:Dynein light chain roadblock-type 2-like isoform X1 n=1 Tax=Biomphalaria glabrata TaxID=6526 RepID=A0A9U8EDU9_BIOGL|nr:dynein light chain roadblock-type 2-like isoform X1 [Biomphalaria glabrata]
MYALYLGQDSSMSLRMDIKQLEINHLFSFQTDAEEIMKRIVDHKGVTQLMVINKNGHPLNMTLEMNEASESQVKHIHEFAIAARRVVRDMDPTDNLVFLRTSSDNFEILISPDEEFTVVVVQEKMEKTTK